MKEKYSVVEVLQIIKTQLETIPVAGKHVQTMAAAMQNLDACIDAFIPAKIERKEDDA